MNHQLNGDDVVTLVRNLAEMDGRVTLSELALSVWVEALQGRAAIDAQMAVRRWFSTEHDAPPSAAAIKKLTVSAATSREAKERAHALEQAPQKVKNPMSYRARNPELWDQLFQQGKREREADLRRRGVIA